MKNTSILIMVSIAVLTLAYGCKKDNDTDEPVDVSKYTIYVIGKYWKNGYVYCFWKNSKQTIVISDDERDNYTMEGCYVSDGDVYLCGSKGSRPVYFKNETMVELDANQHSYSRVFFIYFSDGVVYTAGNHGSGSNYSDCYWINTTRTDITDVPAGIKYFKISGLFAYGGDAYISGHYVDGNNETHACYWKNGVRRDMPEIRSMASSIFIDNGRVYVAGSYERTTLTGTVTEAGYWVDGKFELVVRHIPEIDGIFVEKGTVYTYNKWLGSYWTGNKESRIKPASSTDVQINSIYVKDGIVFTAGHFGEGSGESYRTYPCYWINRKKVDVPITGLGKGIVNELIGVFVE